MIQNHIKLYGKSIVGPLISHFYSSIDTDGNIQNNMELIVQLDSPHFILDVNYEFKKQLKVSNCLCASFYDTEENIRFAYLKLNVYAFENQLNLQREVIRFI